MKKNLLATFSLLFMFSIGISLSADEANNTYYSTSGNYYGNKNTWYNSKAVMNTQSGFQYKATPNGGDYNAVKHTKLTSSKYDTVMGYVKNPNGTVKAGPRTKTSSVKIGALRGTDYHKFID